MRKISIITPTTKDRWHFFETMRRNFYSQTYENIEWVIVQDDTVIVHESQLLDSEVHHYFHALKKGINANSVTIGAKLNLAISTYATGDIIIRQDDDDRYANNWVEKSVESLIESGSDIVGLSSGYFKRENDVFEYNSPKNAQMYLLGASLCFHRHVWERKPFPEVTPYKNGAGEDTEFISNNGRLHCHGYKEGFLATIHGSNTSSHGAIPLMKKVPHEAGLSIIKRFY